jgi:hypothetical protein
VPALGPRNSGLQGRGWQEARHACYEQLWLQRLKQRVESDLELMCSQVARAGKSSSVAFASSERGILHLAQVSPLRQKIRDGTLFA